MNATETSFLNGEINRRQVSFSGCARSPVIEQICQYKRRAAEMMILSDEARKMGEQRKKTTDKFYHTTPSPLRGIKQSSLKGSTDYLAISFADGKKLKKFQLH